MNDSGNSPAGSPQILVVDDTPASLKLLTSILSDKGYHVRPASSGRLALRSADIAVPDLILLDVLMPEMDGYEVCRHLKSGEKTRGVPVIFISSLEQSTDKVKGFEAGGVDFISKPFQAEEILARVGIHLSLNHLQKQLETQNVRLEEEIIERQQKEEELQRYQAHLEELVLERTEKIRAINRELEFHNLILSTQQESSIDGILIVDEKGEIISLNHRIKDLFRIPRDVVLSRFDVFLTEYMEKLLAGPESSREKIQHLMTHQDEIYQDECTLSDGRVFEIYSSPMIDGSRTLFGRAWFFRNITNRKFIEKSLATARKKLNLLNSVVFSDIQNYVFALEGYITLHRNLATDEQQHDFFIKEQKSIRKISDSLHFARLYENMGISPPVWHNIDLTLQFAISHQDFSSFLRNVALDGLEIFADPLLENVFFCLAENVLSHGKTATEISLTYQKTASGLVLVFEDNGIGVPVDAKESIFEQWFGERKGLGLFLSREILAITDLSISETGKPGSGARFEIIIPEGSYRFSRK